MDSNTNNYEVPQNPIIQNMQNLPNLQINNQQDENYSQTYNIQSQPQQNNQYQSNNQYSQNILQTSEENYENSQEKKEENHKRRSKNDTEGRTFICQLCGKSYLSYPALYTHKKQKHNNTNSSSGRGRGRPKKDNNEQNNERKEFNPNSFNYFQKEDRKGVTNEYKKVISDAFNFLYNIKDDYEKSNRNKKRNMKEYNNINDHPLFKKFLNDPHNKDEKSDENENKITDDVFIDYLNNVSAYCNEDFFEKILIFVALFREYVNQFYSNKVENGIEFTTQQKAEDVPDTSNEFILDFIDPDDNNNDFGFSKDECIDLIQNLCHWMYAHNFTCSKLSMINMDSNK